MGGPLGPHVTRADCRLVHRVDRVQRPALGTIAIRSEPPAQKECQQKPDGHSRPKFLRTWT